MRGIGIQPRVPEHRDRDLWRGDRKGEAVQSGAQVPGVPSGTLAIKSEARASASAAAKPPTIVTISRSSPSDCKASSIGPFSRPRRETKMCLPDA